MKEKLTNSRVFYALKEHGPMTNQELAEVFGICRQYSQSFLKELIRQGFATREQVRRRSTNGNTWMYEVTVEEYEEGCAVDIDILNAALKIERPREMEGRVYIEGRLAA